MRKTSTWVADGALACYSSPWVASFAPLSPGHPTSASGELLVILARSLPTNGVVVITHTGRRAPDRAVGVTDDCNRCKRNEAAGAEPVIYEKVLATLPTDITKCIWRSLDGPTDSAGKTKTELEKLQFGQWLLIDGKLRAVDSTRQTVRRLHHIQDCRHSRADCTRREDSASQRQP